MTACCMINPAPRCNRKELAGRLQIDWARCRDLLPPCNSPIRGLEDEPVLAFVPTVRIHILYLHNEFGFHRLLFIERLG